MAAPWLLQLLGVAPDVYTGALGFMRVSFVGILFVFTYAMFQALMRGVGQTKVPLLIVGGTVLANFLLDPLVHLRLGAGRRALGVMGAALATLVTQAMAAASGSCSCCAGRTASTFLARLHARPAIRPARILPRRPGLDRAVDACARADGDVVPGRLASAP